MLKTYFKAFFIHEERFFSSNKIFSLRVQSVQKNNISFRGDSPSVLFFVLHSLMFTTQKKKKIPVKDINFFFAFFLSFRLISNSREREKKIDSEIMTFRNNNNNNNRRNNQGGNFNNNNNYGGNVNPWDGPNMSGGRGGGGNDALALANNLLNNLLRNQNQNNVPPSLLDMAGPRRGGYNDGPRGYNDFRVSILHLFVPLSVQPNDNSQFALKIFWKIPERMKIYKKYFSRFCQKF